MSTNMRIVSGLAATALLTGCATVVAAPRYLRAPTAVFEPSDAMWSQALGKNTISGSAVMRTVGGEAKTCAGLPVELIPESPYARERVTIIFGNPETGYFPTSLQVPPDPDPTYARMVCHAN